MIRNLPCWSFLILALLFCHTSYGQLDAGLSASSTGGCSPVTVAFTNQTTGASSSATYTWDFGNGNKVTTSDPNYSSGATYVAPGIYTITLTVNDGSITSSRSVTVTVYSNPTAGFNLTSGAAGCIPLTSAFQSSSTPGSGTITGYYWDFGDGTTLNGTTPSASHTYTFASSPTVQLTVTNSYGCSATVQQSGLVSIKPSVLPAFTTDSTTICHLGDGVPFVNSTTGPPTLSYLWRFGDGATSTASAPTHAYTAPGVYTVSLMATSSAGCADSLVKTAYVQVAQNKPKFGLPASVCADQPFWVYDSTAVSDNFSSEWTISSTGTGLTQYGATAEYNLLPGTYNLTLSGMFGTCPGATTKTIVVNPIPTVPAFTMQSDTSSCGAPAIWTFSDTAKATAYAWSEGIDYYSASNNVFATTPNASYTFTTNNEYYVALTLTNTFGCQATIGQYLTVQQPNVNIAFTGPLASCSAISGTFSAGGNFGIAKYNWNFGDGTTSTSPTPTHTFTTPGVYNVSLNYTTTNGCTGTTTMPNEIYIAQNMAMNFSILTPNPVCGNSFVTVEGSRGAYELIWNFGDGSGWIYNADNIDQTHQYEKEGTYTVTMIAVDVNNYCTDTVTKVDSITVLPSFPNMSSPINTCAGSRGLVSFPDSVRGATSILWNFGDGTTLALGSKAQDTVLHTYTKSGVYKVMLTSVNGACTNEDSTTVYVLLKQHPLLTATQTSVCADGSLNLTVNNLDTNYWVATPAWEETIGLNWYPAAYQYGDGTFYTGYSWYGGLTDNGNVLTGSLQRVKPGEDSIRVITTSAQFNCNDTTNYVVVKITGPIPGFEFQGGCYKDPVMFTDTSRPTLGGPIVSATWDFGDGTTLTSTSATVSHTYAAAGTYYPKISVTDSSGCTISTIDAFYWVYGGGLVTPVLTVNGPQASFYWTPANLMPGNTATFFNTTNGPYTSSLWTFSSGGTSTNLTEVSRTYPAATNDTVTLVVYDNTPGYCPTDTSRQVVQVRAVSSTFTYASTYVNGNNCPPVIFNFTTTNFNVTNWNWDFGDGATSEGNPDPSHTYNTPGKYYITLLASGEGITDTVTDSVVVKGPYAKVSVDSAWVCAPAGVTLRAVAVNAQSYIWDLGDGTVINASDTFLTHIYSIPGIYKPTLTLEDSLGCKASFSPSGPVLADSLSAEASLNPAHVCDTGTVVFGNSVYSLSQSQWGDPLTYHWNFGTGRAGDTSNVPAPSFAFDAVGTYPISLTVTSVAGCVAHAQDTVRVTRSDPPAIHGPSAVCLGDTLHFSGTDAFPDTVQWTWVVPTLSLMHDSASAFVLPAGNYVLSLIASLGGCSDTATAFVVVHPLPAITITPARPLVCLGGSVSLVASGGASYRWSPATGLNDASLAAPMAGPASTTVYTVAVTSSYGCVDTDSVDVLVATPFQLIMPADTFVCAGDSIELAPQGAYSYQWISGVSSSSPSVWVNPSTPSTYTVVGYDAYGCFSDTASVSIAIEPLPTVHADKVGPIEAGNSVRLSGYGSPDVINWFWSPPRGLSCTNCEDPVSTPDSDLVYTVTGETQYGCTASDTVRISLYCVESAVVVPGAFTPNGDGINDYFYPKGKGARIVKDFRIYGRWGNLVFERQNIALNDISNAWDGTVGGFPQPVGAYVYFVDVICDTGEPFTLRGTVMLER
jgi:gliding motility-associated-like protein